MLTSDLPSHVDAQCGQINSLGRKPGHESKLNQDVSAAVNTTDGDRCGHNATRAVKSDDGSVEALTCKIHEEEMADRIEAIVER